jgi:hypothetical protein
VVEAQGDGARLGSYGHKVAEGYIKYLLSSGQVTDYGMLDGIIAACRKSKDVAGAKPEDLDEIAEKMQSWGQNFILPSDMDRPEVELLAAFDERWRRVDWRDKTARFRAKLDFTYYLDPTTCVITDWKSDRHIPGSDIVNDNEQLLRYAFVKALLDSRITRFILRLHYLRYGRTYEIEITPRDIAHIGRALAQKMTEIDNCTAFLPRMGSHCDWCGYPDLCPKMQNALAVRENPYTIVTAENAGRAAELLLALDRVKSEVNGRLKDYVVAHGPVVVGDEVLAFHPTESTSFPDGEKLAAALLGAGLEKHEVWTAFSATKTSVEKALKKARKSAMLQGVKELSGAIDKTGKRFEFKKVA